MVENKVAERRHALGMTLEELSRESGIPVSTLGEVEKGQEPKVMTALRTVRALNKTIEELWSQHATIFSLPKYIPNFRLTGNEKIVTPAR